MGHEQIIYAHTHQQIAACNETHHVDERLCRRLMQTRSHPALDGQISIVTPAYLPEQGSVLHSTSDKFPRLVPFGSMTCRAPGQQLYCTKDPRVSARALTEEIGVGPLAYLLKNRFYLGQGRLSGRGASRRAPRRKTGRLHHSKFGGGEKGPQRWGQLPSPAGLGESQSRVPGLRFNCSALGRSA